MHATCLECTVGSSKFIVFDGNTSIATSLPQHNRINSIKIIPSISVKNETSVPIHIYIKAWLFDCTMLPSIKKYPDKNF